MAINNIELAHLKLWMTLARRRRTKDALDKIAKINQLLGGNRLTLKGVQELLNNLKKVELLL
jgi:hypothetical protein